MPTKMILPHIRFFGSAESSHDSGAASAGSVAAGAVAAETGLPAVAGKAPVAGAGEDLLAPFLECFALRGCAS